MFDSSLVATIKGLRMNRGNEDAYIANCMRQIRSELESASAKVKAAAISKLWYFQLFGYDMSWACFHVVEVMSYPKFALKLPAYSACATSFHKNTDASLLTTNQFRKDFNSKEICETSLALSCLCCMATPELSQDLVHDVLNLCNSSKPYIRKKAILCLFQLVKNNSQAVQVCLPKLKERLHEDDSGVLISTVTTLLELGRKNPKCMLFTVPLLYHILINTTNNWLIIKLLKFFTLLAPYEPRLAPKLASNIEQLLTTTKAKSVEYEATRLVLCCFDSQHPLIELTIERLKGFIDNSDNNLKYLGLVLLAEIIDDEELLERIETCFPSFREKILDALEDQDPSTRNIALQLLRSIVKPSNFKHIAERLLRYTREHTAGDEYLNTLLKMAEKNNYHLITDLGWYLVILTDNAHTRCKENASTIADQIVHLSTTKPEIRPYATQLCCLLLEPLANSQSGNDAFEQKSLQVIKKINSSNLSTGGGSAVQQLVSRTKTSIPNSNECLRGISSTDVMVAAVRILGEFSSFLDRESCGPYSQIDALKAICNQVKQVTGQTQAEFIWTALKIVLQLKSDTTNYGPSQQTMEEFSLLLRSFMSWSINVDVTERCFFSYLAMSSLLMSENFNNDDFEQYIRQSAAELPNASTFDLDEPLLETKCE